MATSKQTISKWFKEGIGNASHMIVVTDGFDLSDYPVYVKKEEDVREIAKKYDGKDMQKIMEVYNLSLPLKEQLDAKRVFNY